MRGMQGGGIPNIHSLTFTPLFFLHVFQKMLEAAELNKGVQ